MYLYQVLPYYRPPLYIRFRILDHLLHQVHRKIDQLPVSSTCRILRLPTCIRYCIINQLPVSGTIYIKYCILDPCMYEVPCFGPSTVSVLCTVLQSTYLYQKSYYRQPACIRYRIIDHLSVFDISLNVHQPRLKITLGHVGKQKQQKHRELCHLKHVEVSA